jgi:hypothetical protein
VRIAPPGVIFEVRPLVDDGQQGLTTRGRRYVARLYRQESNPQLLWETETDKSLPTDAMVAMRRQINTQAGELGLDIDAIATAIKEELKWSADQALSLALEFVFPATLAGTELRSHVEYKGGRGRPAIIDAQTLAVGRLMAAWQRSVGSAPALGADSTFPKVIAAVAAHFGLTVRGTHEEFAEKRLALLAERKKLDSGRIRYAKSPNVLGELTILSTGDVPCISEELVVHPNDENLEYGNEHARTKSPGAAEAATGSYDTPLPSGRGPPTEPS